MLFNGHSWHPGVLAFCIYIMLFALNSSKQWNKWSVSPAPEGMTFILVESLWKACLNWWRVLRTGYLPQSSAKTLGLFSDFSSKSFLSLLLNIYFFVLWFRVNQRESWEPSWVREPLPFVSLLQGWQEAATSNAWRIAFRLTEVKPESWGNAFRSTFGPLNHLEWKTSLQALETKFFRFNWRGFLQSGNQ